MSYEFKVGDEGLTRSGNKYRVIAIEDALRRPVVVLIDGEGGPYATTKYHSGQYCEDLPLPDDLMPPAVTVYLNVYKYHNGYSVISHTTEGSARTFKGVDVIAVAQPFTFIPNQEK